MTACTHDFFSRRLVQLMDLRHGLAVLTNRMPWQETQASLALRFASQVCKGQHIEDLGLFGPTVSVAGAGVFNARRPRLPTYLMISLLYPKHVINESDEFRHSIRPSISRCVSFGLLLKI